LQIEGRLKQSFSDGLETVKIINVETIYSNYDKPNKTIFNTYAMIHFLSQNISSKQATAIGLLAVALWSFVISLIRSLSLHMGAVGGAAMMYTLSTVLIWLIFGRPHLRNYNRSYLFWASVFFAGCELCLSLSVGFAQNARQAVEIGMVNPSTDELLTKVDSRYGVVVLAAKRARQLLEGDPVKSERARSTKNVTNAFEEIAEGKISYDLYKESI